MGRASLITLLMIGGCFDFDLLERPFDSAVPDLAGADFAGVDLSVPPGADLSVPPGADLSVPPGADLSVPPGADLAFVDLGACLPPPSFAARVFYVAPGAMGDGSSASTPIGSINTAVQHAIMAPDPAVVVIAAGTYVETVTITTGNLMLYGGYNSTFTCRDPSPASVTQLIGPIATNALQVTDGTFTLDGLLIAGGGGGNSNASGVAIDGSAGGTINGTVRGCEVRTQYALGSLVSSGYAMSIQAATVSIDHSYLRAGASGGIGGMWGLFLCSAAVTVTDSTIETNDPGSGHPQFAVDMPAGACGTPGLTPALSITRSKLVAIGGSGAANTGFRLGLPAVTPLFASSALIAVGGNAVVANNASSMPLAMNFLASTINGTTATGGRGINVAQTSQLTLGLIDTIVQGVYAISLSGSSNQLAVNHMGINLLHGSSAVLASTNGAADITAYRSAYGDTSAVDMDPLLSVFDNVHLQGGSPALGLAGASPCSTAKDIDGQTRPQSGACDVGADEQ